MKIKLRIPSGRWRTCRLPYTGADHVVCDGSCPLCGAMPFSLRGGERRAAADDQAWEATAVSVCCGRHLGLLRAEVNTVFGVREDERVLAGPWRVY